jgi:chromate transporter
MIKQVFVDRKKWVTEDDFLTGLSLSQMLPSATGVNTIEFLAYKTNGTLGALIAPICFVFPAFVLMTVLSALYFTYGKIPAAQALFTGLGAVVVALIANAAVTLGSSALKDFKAVMIALTGLALVEFAHVHIVMVGVAGAVLGLLAYRRSIVGDEAPPALPEHGSRLSWLPWIGATAVLILVVVATKHTLSMKIFLSMLHVGMFTFGGGFMSIPIFQHEAVTANHWLTNRQFVDGLALGQITPGPVLITGNFIGFRVLGVWGAVLGSIATFLPGAIGMFIVAHQHERVQHLAWLQRMVRGLVAAFVGVLASVVIRLGMESLVDWRTIGIAGIALVGLMLVKLDPLWVILGGVVVSLILFL